MSLLDANWCPEAAVMLHDGKKISDEKKAELKALFLEGLIRFLDIYSQTEIGEEDIKIDITKVALHINSAQFENDDLYAISTIDDVYSLCESLAIAGLPLWRFLRLSDYQSRIFESGYNEILISAKMRAAEKRPCYGCIWYEETDTPLGVLRRCNKPETEISWGRKPAHEPSKIKKCKWLTTLEVIPKAAENLSESDIAIKHRKTNFFNRIEPAREKFRRNLLKDPFRIPKELSIKETINLDVQYDPMKDLLSAFNNQKTYTERQIELRKAMYIEGMIRFFETYAKNELGTGFVSDIKNIALYVDSLENNEVEFIKTFNDVYSDLEEKIVNGFDVRKYIKFDEDL